MNAKKIMGAVLVALLAAALFVGAGAAATDLGNYYVYQDNTGLPTGVWTYGAASITVDSNTDIIPGENFVAGTYKKGDYTISVSYPTATYAADATIGTIPYLVANGGKVYEGSIVNVAVNPVNTTAGAGLQYLVTYPNGTAIKGTNPFSSWTAAEKGTYKIQAVFDSAKFVNGAPVGIFVDEKSFTFTVIGKDDVTISASAETAYNTEAVTFTVEGTPGEKYNVTVDGFDIATNQLLTISETVPGKVYNITIQNNGKATFVAAVNKSKVTGEDEDIATLTLGAGTTKVKDGKVKITIAPPVVTATLEAASYFLGDDIVITGTSTSEVTSTTFVFNISGTNIKETTLSPDTSDSEYNGKNWKVVLPTNEKLDVGTYTIKIYQGGDVVKTLAVALKQPFISIITAPEVVAQDTKAEFVINAEAAEKVQAYFFGTNYFRVVAGDQDEDIANKFTVTLERGTTKDMDAGQYFVVFQHPMYNGVYNIFADGKDIILNTSNAAQPTTGSFLFNVTDRQTANAAQALCDALDSQNIDDMYVKYSFFIVGDDAAFTISEIPTQVVKGDQIVISGVDTANAGETVMVEMISTAFAAVPKEEVNSAAFIVVTTEVAKDGTWEVTLDTSDLNVDEYALSVVINDATKKNVKVNVIEGEPTVEPTTEPTTVPTEQPTEQPTEPTSPGFGALAALAGLGAVAVLLLRRE